MKAKLLLLFISAVISSATFSNPAEAAISIETFSHQENWWFWWRVSIHGVPQDARVDLLIDGWFPYMQGGYPVEGTIEPQWSGVLPAPDWEGTFQELLPGAHTVSATYLLGGVQYGPFAGPGYTIQQPVGPRPNPELVPEPATALSASILLLLLLLRCCHRQRILLRDGGEMGGRA